MKSRINVANLAIVICSYSLGLPLGFWPILRHGTPSQIAQPRSTNESLMTMEEVGEPHPVEKSAFLPAGKTAFDLLKEKLVTLDTMGELDPLEIRHVVPLFSALGTNEYPKAWLLVRDAHSPELRLVLQSPLIRAWSRKDPKSALDTLGLERDASHRNRLVKQSLQVWAETQPLDAMNWARQGSDDDLQNGAFAAVVYGTAEHDPLTASQILTNLSSVNERGICAGIVAQKLAPINPEAAVNMLGQVENSLRGSVIATIADVKASQSIAEALSWKDTLSSPDEQRIVSKSIVSKLLESNPQEAIDFATSTKDMQMFDFLAETWASKDLQAAASWISGLPNNGLKEQAWQGIKAWWIARDPEAAANFAMTSLASGDIRSSSLREIGSVWSAYLDSETPPDQWAARLPVGTDRDAFLSGLCGAYQNDPQEAGRLILMMSPGDVQTETATSLFQSWSHSNGSAAEKWLEDSGLPQALKLKLLQQPGSR